MSDGEKSDFCVTEYFFSLHSSSSCLVDYIKILKSLLNGPFLPSLSRVRPFLNLYYFALVCIHMYAIHTVRQHQKKFQILFFSSSLKLCTYTRVRACFFLFESSRYDYRWNCNFILMLERKAHKKDNMNKFQFCKPIELDDVVRFMLLPPTKITVTQYSYFFCSQRFKHKSNLSQNDNFIFSFLLIFVLVFLFACVCLFVHRCPIWRPFGWILFTVWTP